MVQLTSVQVNSIKIKINWQDQTIGQLYLGADWGVKVDTSNEHNVLFVKTFKVKYQLIEFIFKNFNGPFFDHRFWEVLTPIFKKC